MVRGRLQMKREAARARELAALEQAELERRVAEERAAVDRRLKRKWGNSTSALNHLSGLSRELEKLHQQEARILRERDELVQWLRDGGQSWALLSTRTKLSRQALMKRMRSA